MIAQVSTDIACIDLQTMHIYEETGGDVEFMVAVAAERNSLFKYGLPVFAERQNFTTLRAVRKKEFFSLCIENKRRKVAAFGVADIHLQHEQVADILCLLYTSRCV